MEGQRVAKRSSTSDKIWYAGFCIPWPLGDTVTAIEDVEWELIDSLDSLVIHVLAVTVPEFERLLDRLKFSVDKKPKLAPGDGCPEPKTLANRRSSWWPTESR